MSEKVSYLRILDDIQLWIYEKPKTPFENRAAKIISNSSCTLATSDMATVSLVQSRHVVTQSDSHYLTQKLPRRYDTNWYEMIYKHILRAFNSWPAYLPYDIERA